jgi:hypothetical protein
MTAPASAHPPTLTVPRPDQGRQQVAAAHRQEINGGPGRSRALSGRYSLRQWRKSLLPSSMVSTERPPDVTRVRVWFRSGS